MSNKFTNLFHDFLNHKFFSVLAVEEENKLLIGPKQGLPVKKEIATNVC
jgi:hypothetical protein